MWPLRRDRSFYLLRLPPDRTGRQDLEGNKQEGTRGSCAAHRDALGPKWFSWTGNQWNTLGFAQCSSASRQRRGHALVGPPTETNKQAPAGNNLERVKTHYSAHVVGRREIRKHILFCICGQRWFQLCMLDPWEVILHTPPCRRIHSMVQNKEKTLQRVWLTQPGYTLERHKPCVTQILKINLQKTSHLLAIALL